LVTKKCTSKSTYSANRFVVVSNTSENNQINYIHIFSGTHRHIYVCMYVKNIYKALSFACAINKRERAHKHTRTAFSQLFARFLGFFLFI